MPKGGLEIGLGYRIGESPSHPKHHPADPVVEADQTYPRTRRVHVINSIYEPVQNRPALGSSLIKENGRDVRTRNKVLPTRKVQNLPSASDG